MFVARVGFGMFWNLVDAAKNALKVAKPVVLPAVLLPMLCVAAAAQSLDINVTEFPIPTPNSYPQDISNGPDGAIWFTEVANRIGRVTKDGVFTEYPLSGVPGFIWSGPDGAIWFTLGSEFGRITTTGTVTESAGPAGFIAYANSIAIGPDGALWFTDDVNQAIGRFTTAGVGAFYKTPTPCNNTSPSLGGITVGSDGAMWFTDACNKSIGRITTGGVVTEYSVPGLSQGDVGITLGPDGAVWFADGPSVGRITAAGVVTEYPVGITTKSGIARGPDDSIWFASSLTPQIGRITMAGVVTTYDLPDLCGHIVLGPDGDLWSYELRMNNILRIQVPARSGVLSHIAAGGGWTTVITLVNTSSAAVPVTVALHGDDGSALTLPVKTTQQGTSQTTTSSSINATIYPNTTLLISMGDQLSSLSVGWADVTSVGPLGGYAIFTQTPQTGSPSEGTVPLQSQFPSTVTLPYDNTAGFVMGVALANLSASSASVTALMWDDSGNQQGTQTITIAGSGHTSFVLPNQFPVTAGKRGIVKFQSGATGGMTGMGLRFSPFGTFTSVPTM